MSTGELDAACRGPREPALVYVESLVWNFVEDAFPDDFTTCLIAVDNPASDEVELGFRSDGHWYTLENTFIQGRVYAWAHAPVRPPEKGASS